MGFRSNSFVDRDFKARYPPIVGFVPYCRGKYRGNGYAGVSEESTEFSLAPTGSACGRMGGVEPGWREDRGEFHEPGGPRQPHPSSGRRSRTVPNRRHSRHRFGNWRPELPLRFPYLPLATRQPIPVLGGAQVRYRPILSVRLFGPSGSRLFDGCLDCASDDTIFPQALARTLGIDLTGAPRGEARPVDGVAIPYHYARVRLRISDGREQCEWEAMVGFASLQLRWALLGHTSFLDYFDTTLFGSRREVILTPNSTFTGQHLVLRSAP